MYADYEITSKNLIRFNEQKKTMDSRLRQLFLTTKAANAHCLRGRKKFICQVPCAMCHVP